TLTYQEAKLIGQPEGTAIYFAVDYDAQPADYAAIEAYLRAAAKELPGYAVGVYGSYAVVEEMAKRKACTHYWQTYAWSKGQLSKAANLYQYKNGQTLAGHTVDFNEALGGEGWWDTAVQSVEKLVDKAAAEKVIGLLGALWTASPDEKVRTAANYAANALRDAAGIPRQ
uniref:glycoside hydrolase domain-containing protein n=1 Tax=Brevibacillus massiliensis TaxID=1118054 RepID=UPI00037E522B